MIRLQFSKHMIHHHNMYLISKILYCIAMYSKDQFADFSLTKRKGMF